MMSAIALLRKKITETDDLIREHELAIVHHPEEADAVSYGLRALVRERKQLTVSFEHEAEQVLHEVCRYRLFKESGDPSLAAVAAVMGGFQKFVSLIYHALDRNSPLASFAVPPDVSVKTAFQFGYSYSGSVGIALTLPYDRALIDEVSLLDETVSTAFGLVQSPGAGEIHEFATRLGRPVVQSAYQWASSQVKYGVGSDVKWCRDGEIRTQLFMQQQELQKFRTSVEQMSDEVCTTFQGTGVLIEAGVKPKSFKLVPDETDGDQVIKGTFDDAISDDHTVEVPRRYNFTIEKRVTTNLATGDETEKYVLQSLAPE